jgi:ER membrane protein complex subunit 3
MQTAFQKGEYLKEPESRGQGPANPLTDPSGMDQMMNMMKGNMVMFIPQTVIMGWINFFFSGFVLCNSPATPHPHCRTFNRRQWIFGGLN